MGSMLTDWELFVLVWYLAFIGILIGGYLIARLLASAVRRF